MSLMHLGELVVWPSVYPQVEEALLMPLSHPEEFAKVQRGTRSAAALSPVQPIADHTYSYSWTTPTPTQ